jgi:hypothetical protein
MAKITSEPLIDALREMGIAPDATRRVVIDIQVGHIPIVHIEHIGDERLLSVIRALEGVEIKREEG